MAQEDLPCKSRVHSFIFDLCDGECSIIKFELISENTYFVEYNFYGDDSITQLITFDEKICKPKLVVKK